MIKTHEFKNSIRLKSPSSVRKWAVLGSFFLSYTDVHSAFAVEKIIECKNPMRRDFNFIEKSGEFTLVPSEEMNIALIKMHDYHYEVVIHYKDRQEKLDPSLKGYEIIKDNKDDVMIVIKTPPIGRAEIFQLHMNESNRTGILIWSIFRSKTPPLNTSLASVYTLSCTT
jgi:hypothetical protein